MLELIGKIYNNTTLRKHSYESIILRNFINTFMKCSVIKFCPINFSIIMMHYASKPKHIMHMYMRNIATNTGACTFMHYYLHTIM